MINSLIDLDNKIKNLHQKVQVRRNAFAKAMQNDLEFNELKKIYIEIKELDKQLENCFEEVHSLRERS